MAPPGIRPTGQVIDLNGGTTGSAAESSKCQRPLGEGHHLTVRSAQRRRQKRAALQTAGVADRRRHDVNPRSKTLIGRQLRGHKNRGDVFHFHHLGRHVEPEARQHVGSV
jgi:hypothetical protein